MPNCLALVSIGRTGSVEVRAGPVEFGCAASSEDFAPPVTLSDGLAGFTAVVVGC